MLTTRHFSLNMSNSLVPFTPQDLPIRILRDLHRIHMDFKGTAELIRLSVNDENVYAKWMAYESEPLKQTANKLAVLNHLQLHGLDLRDTVCDAEGFGGRVVLYQG